MTSPPDVQNVPDVWALLEQASASIYRLFHQTDDQRALISDINAALAQRDRFVLVPKEPERSDERERILKIIREELHQSYVRVQIHGCLFIERGYMNYCYAVCLID